MKIGVTVQFQHSYFSAGSAQTALCIGETLRLSNHNVVLLHVGNKDVKWWNDIETLQKDWPVQHIDACSSKEFDLVLEIGKHTLSVEQRHCTKESIWVCRKPALLSDIEESLWSTRANGRFMEGVTEVWMIDELTTEDDLQYIELQTRRSVRRVPFVWSPSSLEAHRAEKQSPVWQQVAQMEEVKNRPFSIHICETNNTAASSCYIPLFIAKEAKKKWDSQVSKDVHIHNTEHLKDVAFFKDNVYSKAVDSDISGHILSRQRCIDLVYDPKSIVIAHSRFQKLRPYLLDCLWVGVPIVHNSEWVANVLGVKEGFYINNDILGGREAFGRVIQYASTSTLDDLFKVRKQLLEEVSPVSKKIQTAYSNAIQRVMEKNKSIKVGFCDMWENFQADYNPFLFMLRAATKQDIVGVNIRGNEKVDILVFGPFGDRWRSVDSSIPKIHYTGENTKPIEHPDVKLNLGFEHNSDANYIRLPLWMLEINWFRADVNRLQNPKPVSIDACCQVKGDLEQRKKFCAFVVSNPCNTKRNDAFHWLSKYKQVDSAGRLFNNVGTDLFAGLGGGGGELKKVDFMKQYKFALTFENASSPGYTTEKMFHAKVAGCVPIYWGDSEVEKDFDPKGFIDARNVKTEEELIALVKEVDTNDELWKEKASVPAFTPKKRDDIRRHLAMCAKRMLELAGVRGEFPSMIGFASDKDDVVSKESSYSSSIMKEIVVCSADQTLFVTGVNSKFLPVLQVLLQTIQAQRQTIPHLQALVYLMKDVSVEQEEELKKVPFVITRRFPAEGAYPDIWEPQHFAWKVFILQQVVKEEVWKGRPIVYIDAGVMVARWPEAWIQKAREKGIVLLEDPRQENRRWCHAEFCKQLKTTEEEMKAQQIWAGAIAFVGGAKPALELFEEAWTWAQVRNVIVGAKWSGLDSQGKPMGHRHDQSILSVLSQRRGVARMPLDGVYGDISLRQTFLKGQSLYAHRGQVNIHQKLVEGIDDAWVINLDRRKDRLEKFVKTNESIAERVLRMPAFDGKTLPLTPKLARLFVPHDFKWKKSVMGCALSHLAMWLKLATDKPDIQSYLICEDDAVLDPKWKDTWSQMMKEKALPDNWDVVYLGGILPPNRKAFEELAVEKVNSYIGRVKENTIFGPSSRYFHFCAYAYVLSRRGAQKILEVLKAKGGYWTSADHMICNIHQVLNIYFTHPLLAGCFQDNDPVYQQSQFNDFSRVDSFDSDLWNNTETFRMEEVHGALQNATQELDLLGALEDARKLKQESVDVIGKESVEEAKEELLHIQKSRRLVTVAGPKMEVKHLFEYDWLKSLFGHDFVIENVKEPQNDSPIVVLQGYANVKQAVSVLKGWKEQGKKFYILHLSDEYGRDPIEMYEWAEGVVRTYRRDDVKETTKIKIIPLGYHWTTQTNIFEKKQPKDRDYVWSFVGTGWKDREEKLRVCTRMPGKHKLKLLKEWLSPESVSKEDMLALLENSQMIPCPVGNNAETFRLYEALEAGCVPILVKEEQTDKLMEWLSTWMKILPCENWLHATQLMYTLKEKPEVYEQYRAQLLHGWEHCKRESKMRVHEVFQL